jgi:CRP/FNR family transcriptional regulator, nitrogen fixation regulation protein
MTNVSTGLGKRLDLELAKRWRSAQDQIPTFLREVGLTGEEHSSYQPNAEIVREDDPANHIYQVISGAVCTYKMLSEGRRQIAGFYFTGDIFGLEAVEKHSLAAQAITKAAVRVIKRQALNALITSNHEFSDYLLSLITRELVRKQNQVLVLSRGAYERVICFLVEMAQRAAGNQNRIELPMTRQDTADYLGLTIETVSRVFWDLQRRGAIDVDGRHSIVLRDQIASAKGGSSLDIFDAVKGRTPKTEQELDEWLSSLEGKAATLFKLTPLSRWGDRARC